MWLYLDHKLRMWHAYGVKGEREREAEREVGRVREAEKETHKESKAEREKERKSAREKERGTE